MYFSFTNRQNLKTSEMSSKKSETHKNRPVRNVKLPVCTFDSESLLCRQKTSDVQLKNVRYAHLLIYENFFPYNNIELDIGLPPGQLPNIYLDSEDTSCMPSIPPPKNYRQLHTRHMDKIQESTPPIPDATKKESTSGIVDTPTRPIPSTNSSSSGQ